jgi:E3 ubiquitin-protein ligase HERC4
MEKGHIRNTVNLQDSALLTWGDGKDGKLGHHTEESLHVPYVITALQQIPIMSAALGKRHSLFLTEEGMVLACGNGQFGQLGLGSTEDARLTPVLIQGLHNIAQVAAGDYHSMALNREGQLFAWGSGSWGKLGLSYDGNVTAPRVISTLTSTSVKSVACGSHHTGCITFSGDVWTWSNLPLTVIITMLRFWLKTNSCAPFSLTN